MSVVRKKDIHNEITWAFEVPSRIVPKDVIWRHDVTPQLHMMSYDITKEPLQVGVGVPLPAPFENFPFASGSLNYFFGCSLIKILMFPIIIDRIALVKQG